MQVALQLSIEKKRRIVENRRQLLLNLEQLLRKQNMVRSCPPSLHMTGCAFLDSALWIVITASCIDSLKSWQLRLDLKQLIRMRNILRCKQLQAKAIAWAI